MRHDGTSIRGIQFIDVVALVFFPAMLAMGFLLVKERLMLDGAFLVLEMLIYEKLPSLQNRFVIALLEWMPILAAKFGISVKTILSLYLINEVLYYVFIFSLLRFWLKDIWAAWFMLLIYTVSIGSNYYLLVEGLTPGLVMGVLFFSLLRHQGIKPIMRYIGLAISSFYVAFSHPMVMSAVIFCGAYFIVSSKFRKDVLPYLLNNKTPLIFMALMFLSRAWMALNSPYESQRGSDVLSSEKLDSFLAAFSYDNLVDLFYLYAFSYTTVTILAVVSIIILIRRKEALNGVLFLFLMLGYFAFLAYYVDLSQPKFFWFQNQQMDRWITPINILILSVFFIGILLPNWDRRKLINSIPVSALLSLLLAYNIYAVVSIRKRPQRTVKQYEYLLTKAAKNDTRSKLYIPADEYDLHSYIHHGNFASSIMYCLIEGYPQTYQVEPFREHEVNELGNMPIDQLYMNFDMKFNIRELNESRFFNIETGPYQELIYDPEDFEEYLEKNYPELSLKQLY